MSWFKNKVNESEAALAELQASFESVSAELANVREALIQAEEMSATHLAEFTRVSEEAKTKDERITSLETELAETSRDAAEFDDKVAAKAAAEIATLGVPPLDIIEDDAPVDLVATFKTLRGNEMVKFYNENKQAIQEAVRRGS